VASAERRLIGLRAQLLAAEREQRSVHAALATTEQAEKDLTRFYRDVLPQDLGGARRQTYARLAALAHEHNLAIERRSYDEHKRDTTQPSRLEQLDIKMILNGTYDDVRDFIYALETSSEFVVIEDVGIAQDTQAEGSLRLSLQLTTYFRGPEHGD
jgi:type IV pilus assembly protein PilO